MSSGFKWIDKFADGVGEFVKIAIKGGFISIMIFGSFAIITYLLQETIIFIGTTNIDWVFAFGRWIISLFN